MEPMLSFFVASRKKQMINYNYTLLGYFTKYLAKTLSKDLKQASLIKVSPLKTDVDFRP